MEQKIKMKSVMMMMMVEQKCTAQHCHPQNSGVFCKSFCFFKFLQRWLSFFGKDTHTVSWKIHIICLHCSELKTRRSSSPEDFGNVSRTRVRSRSPCRKRLLRTLRSRSRDRIRRSRSRERRDRSKSSSIVKRRRRSKSRDRLRSHSREDDRRSEHGHSGSRDKRREEAKMKQG